MKRLRNVKQIALPRRFAQDKRGATTVEFALVSVPFFGLLLAILETGFVAWANEGLQTAVADAGRNLMTGVAQTSSITTADQFRTTYICPANGPRILPSFIDCSKLIIDVRSYPVPASYSVFATLDTANDFYATNATRLFCPGNAGAITIVRVAYPMPVYLPILIAAPNNSVGVQTAGQYQGVPGTTGNTHLLLATSVFQAEPYTNGTYTPPPGC